MKYQQMFNEQLRNSISDDHGLSNQLKKVLHLSKESIYRRVRNETAYTLEELAALAKYFKISLDNLILDEDTRQINLFCSPIFSESGVFHHYIDKLNEKLLSLVNRKGEVLHVAPDLPITQTFLIPELRNFKAYYWQKVILNRSRLRGIAYNAAYHLGEVNRSVERLIALHQKVARTEIWTEETIDATIRQIRYCDESGLFENPEDKERVVLALLELLNNLESRLEEIPPAHIPKQQFFVSSIELPNHFMVFRSAEKSEAFLHFSVFNSCSSTNKFFCNEVEMLIESIIRKSVNISGQSDIHRHRFFQNMRKKVVGLLDQMR